MVANVEQRRSIARRILDAMSQGVAMAPEAYMHVPPEELAPGPRGDAVRSLIRQAIDDVANDGYAVIVAHAASHALAGRAGVLRVFVIGSPEVRAGRVPDAADEDAALRQITESDRARAAYLEQFYGVKEELATHYDLVINTDVLTPAEAAQLVVWAARIAAQSFGGARLGSDSAWGSAAARARPEAVLLVRARELQRGRERAGVGVDVGRRVAALAQPRGHGVERAVAGLDVGHLVPRRAGTTRARRAPARTE